MMVSNAVNTSDIQKLKEIMVEYRIDIKYIKKFCEEQSKVNEKIQKQIGELVKWQTKQKAIFGFIATIGGMFGGVIIWIIQKLRGET